MTDEIDNLFKEYAQGTIDRRELLRRLAALSTGVVVAAEVASGPDGGQAMAEVVPKDDPRLETGYIQYPGANGDMRAYSAKPKGAGKLAGVIVIHENRGLNPHTEDIARRVALEGFWAIAPDALSPVGGTPQNPDEARSLLQKLDREVNTRNFVAAVEYLKTNPQTTGKVACMGFCWGGAVCNQVAVNSPDLTAAVPFYGSQPATEDVPKIKAAMLIHYAGDDARINAGIPEFEEALKKAGIEHTIHMYEGAAHAFMNDTGQRYNKEAADLAWKRTIEFLKKKLG
ncbi:MAG TPA: dienelactone hydrolase family protein [Acidobacteriota bacterium]|nr:dienelactone hydrolase family protein [Acidobacteriota bacterium]